MSRLRAIALLLSLLSGSVVACADLPAADQERTTDAVHALPATDDRQFRALLRELAEAWNAGDAARAAACFTGDAVYSQPPHQQLYEGTAELYEFFGGDRGRPGEMQMVWHHLAYAPQRQVGFGEFSFTYGTTAHGVAVIKIRDGKIANWREYWEGSDLPWQEFTKQNVF